MESLQITEPPDDEFLGIEIRGITWATHFHPGGAQQDDGRWIEAEEMQSPSIRTTTLDPIKEGAMAVIQQTLPEQAAMTIRDEALPHQRDRLRFDVAPKRQVWV